MQTLPELIDEFISYYVDLAASQRADGADAPPPEDEWEWFRDEMLAMQALVAEVCEDDDGIAPSWAKTPLPADVAATLERCR